MKIKILPFVLLFTAGFKHALIGAIRFIKTHLPQGRPINPELWPAKSPILSSIKIYEEIPES